MKLPERARDVSGSAEKLGTVFRGSACNLAGDFKDGAQKFVVTDFNQKTAKVFTGSSNLAPSGEKGNGDHLILIEDQKIATGYAIEALRVFDHLHFRSVMKDVLGGEKPKKGAKKADANTEPKKDDALTLKKPIAISGKKNTWFDRFYVAESQLEKDRTLFSR